VRPHAALVRSARRAARRASARAVAVVAAAAVGGACGGGTAAPLVAREEPASAVPVAPSAAEALLIGAVLDLSGPGRDAERPAAAAVEAAAASAGTMAGRPVAALVRDGAGDLDVTVDQATALLAAGAVALVVGCGEDLAAAAATVASRRQVPVISACSTGPVAADHLFTLGPAAARQAEALARLAGSGGTTSLVTLAEFATPGSVALCAAVARLHAGSGGRLVGEVGVGGGGLGVAELVQAVPASDDAVVVSCAGAVTTRAAVVALRAAGSGVRVFAGTAADVLAGEPWAVVGDLGILSVAAGGAAGPTGTAMAATSAVEIVVAAVGAVGDVDGPALGAALRDRPFRTALGTVGFDVSRRVAPSPLRLVLSTPEATLTFDIP
jgi:ABC-type branched-subunit amino acid transport system substrate-binding protein